MPAEDRIGPLGSILRMISEGMGPTAGLAEYRAAGGAIRTQRWFRAWGEMAAEASRRDMLIAAPLGRPPDASEISKVTSQRPGAYLYRGQVLVVDREDGLAQWRWGSVRSQSLIDYGQALAAIEAQVAMGQDAYGYSSLGGAIVAVRELVGDDLVDE